jgi:hypothetical protein
MANGQTQWTIARDNTFVITWLEEEGGGKHLIESAILNAQSSCVN